MAVEVPAIPRVIIPETTEGSITVSPSVYDALRHADLLRQIGTDDRGFKLWGYDHGEAIQCWLIEGERIFSAQEETMLQAVSGVGEYSFVAKFDSEATLKKFIDFEQELGVAIPECPWTRISIPTNFNIETIDESRLTYWRTLPLEDLEDILWGISKAEFRRFFAPTKRFWEV